MSRTRTLERSGVGRKKADDPKAERITIRLTGEQLARLNRIAELEGFDVSPFARSLVLTGLRVKEEEHGIHPEPDTDADDDQGEAKKPKRKPRKGE